MAMGFFAPKACNIIWHLNMVALSSPDEGHFKTVSCALNIRNCYFLLYFFLSFMDYGLYFFINGIQINGL